MGVTLWVCVGVGEREREREKEKEESHTFGENPLRHFPRFIVANVKVLNEQPFVEKTQF